MTVLAVSLTLALSGVLGPLQAATGPDALVWGSCPRVGFALVNDQARGAVFKIKVKRLGERWKTRYKYVEPRTIWISKRLRPLRVLVIRGAQHGASVPLVWKSCR